jgi:hypothetical protein
VLKIEILEDCFLYLSKKKKKNRVDGFIYVKVDSDTGRILLDYLGLFIKLLLAVCIGLALSVISVDFV